ncbi:MAG: class II glutamine amidotransferase, partial [Candidatus Coatesbacteria bacterium]
TTEGEPAERNSHPFKYNIWLFAHIGSVNRDNLLSLLSDKYKNVLEGETDSEVYFYWILQSIEDSKGDVIEGIKKAVGSITSGNCSGLNFLLSNGRCIYAFRYYKGSKDKYSLWFLRRDPSEVGELKFESDETGALLRSKLLKGERAVLVCSEKLTKKEGWQNIKCGNMLIIGSDLNTKETKIL